MDDAIKIADSIEHLARWGQRTTAAEAVEIVDRVGLLMDLLTAELNATSHPDTNA